MRTTLLVVSSALVLTACQFEAHVGGGGGPAPQTPVNANAPTPAPAPVADGTPAPTTNDPASSRGMKNPLAGVKVGAPNPAPAFDPRVRPSFSVAGVGAAIPVVLNATDFGSTKPETDSLVGLVYFLPGPVDKLPDLGTVQPTYKLYQRIFSVGPQAFVGFNQSSGAPRNTNFAVRYTGSFNVTKAGDYTMYIDSKEGARLTIDNKLAIDNDGVHGRTFKNTDLTLAEGSHTIVLDYFAGVTNDVALSLFISPKGVADSAKVWSPQVAF